MQTYTNINDKEELINTRPNECSGNACDDIEITGSTFHPGTVMVKSMTIINNGNKSVVVEVTWGGVFTPCSITSKETLTPNQSNTFITPNTYISGYCKIKANYK